MRPAATPGHGVSLRPEVLDSEDAVVRVSSVRDRRVRTPGRALL